VSCSAKIMMQTEWEDFDVGKEDRVLVTGATGFMGSRLVENLVRRGYKNLRCFARPSSDMRKIESLVSSGHDRVKIEVIKGNLLSREDCTAAVRGCELVYHLAAQRGEKSYPDAFLNSVVTTRNLLEACCEHSTLRRFVNVSSFAVYTNEKQERAEFLDETCPVELHPEQRGDAYCFAKVRQDDIVVDYGKRCGIPYVIVRPGAVYGPGNLAIPARVGIAGFGVFLHLGGSNTIPFTYADNCVDAIALAGLTKGIDGEIFNIVDDDLPNSRQFLRLYKKHVKRFTSIYLPHFLSYGLCCLWEKYSIWSEGQLPPVYNRNKWTAVWRRTNYSNEKLKTKLGWRQQIPTSDALQRYFEACREGMRGA
jgi:2-alkyl-3-oxoalkanoate reductase